MRISRAILAVVLLGSWILAVVFRLYDLQVRQSDHFKIRAEKQQQRVVELDAPRGTIYDSRGRELAVSVEVSSIAAHPPAIEQARETADRLAALLDLDADELHTSLISDRQFVWVSRKVDPPLAEAVRDLNLRGISFLPESKRYFPMRSLAANVLGYVGTDNSGLAGLEYRFEKVIASEKGRRTVLRDGLSDTVVDLAMEEAHPTPGQDLYLTLDAAIQHVVERELAAAVDRTKAKRGSVVVLDPRSGAVLAMASYPSFDPNEFWTSPAIHWRNQPVTDAYEPGSTFKLITVGAALETGLVDPLQVVDCGMGGITLDRVRIDDHHPFGDLTVTEVIAKSSNVGAIKLGYQAGPKRLFETIEAFGFGRQTGIDLPSESPGILQSFSRWSPLTPAYISFGQGIAITPLQLASAFAVIANGGELLRPYLVERIGNRPHRGREVVREPLTRSSVKQLENMLERVVLDGTAKAAAVNGYRVAGKTGTAQKAQKQGGYAEREHIASFVGFAPLPDPVMVAAVVLDEPWPDYHGGTAAAPVFSAIADQILLYLGIPPQRRLPPPELQQAPVVLARHQPLPVADPPGTMPDLSGLSSRQAVLMASRLGLQPTLHGRGRVSRQVPAAGTPIETIRYGMELWFGPTVGSE